MLPLPAIELSSDAQALQVNAAMTALTGLTAAELLGTGWFAALSPDRRAQLFTALHQQGDFELELRLLRHDGVKAWVDLSARWLPQSGSFLCLLADRTALHQAAQDAQAVASRFGLLADNVPVLIAYYDSTTLRCMYANRQYAATFDLTPEAVVGRTFAQVIGEEAAAEIQPQVDLMLRARRTVSYVRQMGAAPGPVRWIDVSLVPHLSSEGLPIGAFVLISDITRHREAEFLVRQSEERMAKFMAASVEGIAFHKDGFITDVNEPMAALVGSTPAALRGRHVFEFVPPHQQPRVQQVMSTGAELAYETEIVDVHGQSIPVEFIVRTLRRGDEVLRMTVVRDIRDRQAAQARIRQLAHHDALTGLFNRAAFVELLDATLAHPPVAPDTGARDVALLFIDLDHFKQINDALGHLAGDALLRALGERIGAALPPRASAARFGGDEFVVMLPGMPDRRSALAFAQRLRAAIAQPVVVEGRELTVTPTVGVALSPEDGRDADTLLRHADAALYAGKAAGRDAVTLFDAGMGDAIDAGLQLDAQLAQALAHDEFELLLQPRWRLADHSLAAVQVQLRWRHPQRGWLAPADFVDRVAQRRLLQPVAEWALRGALQLQRQWADAGHGRIPLVIGLGRLLSHGQALAHTVAHVLAQQPAAPAALQLEVHEGCCSEEAALMGRWLHDLQTLGVSVWVDEFGSGGMALAHLRQLPLAGLNLDRSLVGAMPGDASAAAVLRAVVALGHGLGLPVCATGVLTAAQRQWLADAGCDQVQGGFFEAPMTAAHFGSWLAQREVRR
ncbi:MAG: EAL domain-containing protein [Burkholderiales bacterium]|nr:EAL domain-containing protein [Burkholderiales bacterium]